LKYLKVFLSFFLFSNVQNKFNFANTRQAAVEKMPNDDAAFIVEYAAVDLPVVVVVVAVVVVIAVVVVVVAAAVPVLQLAVEQHV
jgi:hypothetical protein